MLFAARLLDVGPLGAADRAGDQIARHSLFKGDLFRGVHGADYTSTGNGSPAIHVGLGAAREKTDSPFFPQPKIDRPFFPPPRTDGSFFLLGEKRTVHFFHSTENFSCRLFRPFGYFGGGEGKGGRNEATALWHGRLARLRPRGTSVGALSRS